MDKKEKKCIRVSENGKMVYDDIQAVTHKYHQHLKQVLYQN